MFKNVVKKQHQSDWRVPIGSTKIFGLNTLEALSNEILYYEAHSMSQPDFQIDAFKLSLWLAGALDVSFLLT